MCSCEALISTLDHLAIEIVHNRKVVQVVLHHECMGFFLNMLGDLHGCKGACIVFLCMPVTSCAAERN
jgi:hypothetical protein